MSKAKRPPRQVWALLTADGGPVGFFLTRALAVANLERGRGDTIALYVFAEHVRQR